MSRLHVIGNANMDVMTRVRRQPMPGETLLIDDIRLVPGGKGANTAVAAARLGSEVRFVGCVGIDAFGYALRDALLAEGIDCKRLQSGERGTGTAIILLNQANAQNVMMVGPGASHQVALPDDDGLFDWADVLMLQLETPVALNIDAAGRARANDVRVVLDPAPAVDDLPDELLRLADIVSPNESELSTLTGSRIDSVNDAVIAAQDLIGRGVKEPVIKLGDKGAFWINAQTCEHFAVVPIDPVNTTAAGDAFTVALSVTLAGDGWGFRYAIRQACLAGALSCTRFGALPSLPTHLAMQEFLVEPHA